MSHRRKQSMKIFKIILLSLGVFALLCALILVAIKRGARDGDNARLALNAFLSHAKNHDYNAAHRMLSDGLQSDVSTRDLENQWANFEREHGAVQQWKPAPGFFVSGGQVSTVPRFVQLRYLVKGARDGNTAGAIFVRMTPQNGDDWRVSKMEIRP